MDEEYYTFHADSSDRLDFDNTTDDSFTVEVPHLGKYTHVSLLSMSCNKSFYNVNTPYNTFYLNGVLITIPIGNYRFSTFGAVLKGLMDGQGYGVWTWTANTLTGKYSVSTTYGSAITLVFQSNKVLSRVVGFNPTETFTTSTISRYVVDFQRTSMLYVVSNIVRGDAEKRILSAVPFTSSDFSRMTFVNPFPEGTAVPMSNGTNVVKLEIFDDNFNSINFNGNQVVMSLLFSKKHSKPVESATVKA